MAKIDLKEMYRQAATAALAAGVPVDDSPNGALHNWVKQNINYRPETEFFIVFGIACEMADIKAKSAGYDSEVQRAYLAAQVKTCGCPECTFWRDNPDLDPASDAQAYQGEKHRVHEVRER